MNKFWELTPIKFLLLTITSHISLAWLLFFGSIYNVIATILIAIFILLFVSVPFSHRYLSHKSWNPPDWYKTLASILTVFSFTGSTISRTVVHRQHHAFVDESRDPHSPFLVHWLKIYFPYFNQTKINLALARDLTSDILHRNIHQYYLLIVLVVFLLLIFTFGLNWALAIAIAPGALCWMNVCILNTIGHQEKGGSNSLLLSFLTLGEGNHKYHHEHPNDPNPGQGSFDPAYTVIKIFNKK